jgi:hypothetical protein
MAWYDGVLSNTVGVAFRAVTGNVDPWTLQQIKDDTAAGIVQASGSDGDPAAIAAAQAQANSAIDANLLSEDAHPSQAGVRLPGLGVVGSADFLKKLERIVYGIIFVAGIGGAVYFGYKYRKTFKAIIPK